MIPVTHPVNPAMKAIMAGRQPFFSITAEAITQTIHAPSEQRSHCHHRRSDGLKGIGDCSTPKKGICRENADGKE
jgi:hypothetical protein